MKKTARKPCEGDQGTTYYYGNVFLPEPQNPFERDAWTCVEIGAKANSVGNSDGELALWVNDDLVGRYRPGKPTGTWLRAQFHTGGCDFSACREPMPFEGFDFRSSDDVLFKSIILDAYYERGSSADKKTELESRGLTVSDTQTLRPHRRCYRAHWLSSGRVAMSGPRTLVVAPRLRRELGHADL